MLRRRDLLGAAGIFLVAIGLAHREAFYSVPGAVLVPAGFLVLLLAARSAPREPGAAYAVLLVLLCVASALAPYDPAGVNVLESALTVAAALVFYLAGGLELMRRYRLYLAGALLLAAHAHFLARFPSPEHEDVWHFLNGGVDLLLRGANPYRGVPIVEDGVHKVLTYTYPPGALLALSPFRVLLGDVRWAYIFGEAVVVALWGWHFGRSGREARGREALALVPLALPRSSQAFYIFTNHEWVLLALALAGIVLALRRRDVVAGAVLGLGIACKQYFVIYPLVFMAPVLRRRTLVAAAVVTLVVVLPFAVWDPRALVDAVFGNLSQAPTPDRLTAWAILAHAGLVLPRAVLTVLTVVSFGGGLYAAWRTRADLSKAMLVCGLALALFAFFSAFAAYNYYVYALAFVTWGLILSPAPVAEGPA